MTARPRSETAVGVLLVLLSAASYGTMPVLAHIAYDSGADTQTFLAWRFVLAAAVIWPIVLLRRRRLPHGRLLAKVFVLGGVVYVGQASPTSPPCATATSRSSRRSSTPTRCSSWCSRPHPDRGADRTKLAAVLIGVAGAVLTVGGGGHAQALGIVLAIAAGLIFSCYFILTTAW